MKLVTSAEMSAIDARAQSEFSIPGAVLMESAGKAAWDHLTQHHLGERGGQSIVFVAGSGNNGGDALVMARYCALEGRHNPLVLLARKLLKGDAELQRNIIGAMGVPMMFWEADQADAEECLRRADWIVDGLAGTGLAGPLRSPHAEIAQFINSARARVAAIDAPSGVGDRVTLPREAVRADLTLTLGLPKRCLYDPAHRGNCGQIAVISFTLPTQLVAEPGPPGELLEHCDLADLLPPIPGTAHKGERGVLAVFAGSVGTTGAAVLASQSALAAGAGLVTLFADNAVYVPLTSHLTSVMVRPDDGPVATGPADPSRFGAVVVGPGWGTSERRATQLVEIIDAFKTGVIDADGLTLLSAVTGPPSLPNWVLTPHPAELGRLVDASTDDVLGDMYGFAGRAAEMYGAVVVAKASTTIVADPGGRVAVVDGMNPSLATAGSGDVLAGVIGALLSRGIPAWDAARAGVVAHAVAGRRLGDSAGLFRSAELAPEIARVMGEIILPK